ncbi:hypothetical protein J14TS2_08210 [Bacillus sp. J14TS2]|uniref:hypothetical protein n=1 Tax=Bacillus sp. J14TS2 TaxID=2807188 RepID=UPI001B07DB9C|nr:hypothetical protein [Bacillus sp. J14TS2]GIN70346.1 hypothetical protein J14TS2_08210 [Bacillus sp. J14TS2]
MAFGITKLDLHHWKQEIDQGKIAFLTHYWLDARFPDCKSVTKVGCHDLVKLAKWGEGFQLKEEWIHHRKDGYSHYDLLGEKQIEVLEKEGLLDQIKAKIQLN